MKLRFDPTHSFDRAMVPPPRAWPEPLTSSPRAPMIESELAPDPFATYSWMCVRCDWMTKENPNTRNKVKVRCPSCNGIEFERLEAGQVEALKAL